ncbi:hypothetical protein [Variovorax sp. YR566]|uniref:hypothetical protein n=1 Tax=Variovorax sp. YR566 TaxID=3450237 RepID=UPI003F7E502D
MAKLNKQQADTQARQEAFTRWRARPLERRKLHMADEFEQELWSEGIRLSSNRNENLQLITQEIRSAADL